MRHRLLCICGAMAFSTATMFGDFSYHESTKITGGAMAGVLKVAGVFSKTAREPMESNVALKGNRMAHRSNTHMSVIDLDAKTITNVDLQKKQYSVMTFDQMRQALEEASRKMKEEQAKKGSDAEMNLRVSADPTGKTKDINGYNAREILMKITMDVNDKKNNQSGSMVVYFDVWIADVAGYAEVREFYTKMAKELNWTPGANLFSQQPEMAKGMAEAYKEVSKMNGAPVFQKMSMGPEGIAPPNSDAPAAKEDKPKPSAGSVLGGALGGRFGLGRKKQDPPPQEQAPAQQGTGSMIEMETQYSNFATTADASLFEIPTGFKQVESEMTKKSK
jgi:hypothetical protein